MRKTEINGSLGQEWPVSSGREEGEREEEKEKLVFFTVIPSFFYL